MRNSTWLAPPLFAAAALLYLLFGSSERLRAQPAGGCIERANSSPRDLVLRNKCSKAVVAVATWCNRSTRRFTVLPNSLLYEAGCIGSLRIVAEEPPPPPPPPPPAPPKPAPAPNCLKMIPAQRPGHYAVYNSCSQPIVAVLQWCDRSLRRVQVPPNDLFTERSCTGAIRLIASESAGPPSPTKPRLCLAVNPERHFGGIVVKNNCAEPRLAVLQCENTQMRLTISPSGSSPAQNCLSGKLLREE